MADSTRVTSAQGTRATKRGRHRRTGKRPLANRPQNSREPHVSTGATLGDNGLSTKDTGNGAQPGRGNQRQGPHGGRLARQHRGRDSGLGSQGKWTTRTTPQWSNGGSVNSETKLSPAQIQDILEDSLSDITRSQASKHAIINQWGAESGLAKVREIVESDFAQFYSVTRLMFDPHCVLFLCLLSYISQEEIQNSLILEKAVGTIYNVIYGPNGNRGVQFFRRVVSYLVHLRAEKPNLGPGNERQYEEVLLHTTEAILSTLLQNQEATVKTEFRAVIEELSSCFPSRDMHGSAISSHIHLAGENYLKIQDIFGTGDASAHKGRTGTSETQRPKPATATVKVDFPGDLSQHGRRHDNDHAAIPKIKILPTLSEIWCSQRDDFLPTQDALYSPDKHHEKGIRRLLDTHFRLLREDTSGVLRNAVRVILDNWQTIVHGSTWQEKRKVLRVQSPTPVRIYYGAQVKGFNPSRVKGAEINVEFDQVHRAKSMTVWKRKHYWRESRSLKEGGAILALIDGQVAEDMNIVFLQVSKRNIDPVANDDATKSVRDLVSDGKRAAITLRLTSAPSGGDLLGLVSLANNQRSPVERPLILVEFPALLYNSFEGVLRCLQTQYLDPRYIPFTGWIAPRDKISQNSTTAYRYQGAVIPAPAYLEHTALDLSSIPKPANADNIAIPLIFSVAGDQRALVKQLSQRTTLDLGQAQAMVSALTNEIALIQGPPGTGKSYVGIQLAKCLLKNRLGPILCVCYTSHALDQFLQGLVDSGIKSIVRIGSRSNSPFLESLSLDEYKNRGEIPRIEGNGRKITESQNRLDMLASAIGDTFKLIESGDGMVRKFLQKRFPQQHEQIARQALSGVNGTLDSWARGDGPGDINGNGDTRSIEQLLTVNVWTLTNQERDRLQKYWHDSAVQEFSLELQKLMQQHALEKQQLTALFLEKDAQIFNQVDVVGVTTTGLANNADLLRKLRAKVLICEEAGEVLESHFLTTLLPSLQHVILIGDHLQLRPKISNKRLSKEYDLSGPKYNLDESIFERLATSQNGDTSTEEVSDTIKAPRFPVAQLDCQRRMHPSIARLVRETLYPNLRDHSRTESYDEIPGMRRRLFWLDHRNMEDPGDPEDPMQSKTNTWEAEMVIALVQHLFKQGKYKSGEIAILTPYIGQLRLLKDKLEGIVNLVIAEEDLADLYDSEAEDPVGSNNDRRTQSRPAVEKEKLLDRLRLATVDNFQGDEATVVVVSLVRSNQYRNCGFLKTPNRINVLLSRAKHGMYIIGDANTASSAPMWSSVITILEESQNIGPKLELECSRHPDNMIYVSSSEDFLIKATEGGCAERCERRLACGHTCPFKCHSNALHGVVRCMAICTKMRTCGHSCPKRCHEACGECLEKITGAFLACGHTAEIECRRRGDLASMKCMKAVMKKIPRCGHDILTLCHKDIKDVNCSHPCEAVRNCGHICRKPCATCKGSAQAHHGRCANICGKPFTTCAHSCTQPCHPSTPCAPCKQPCEVRCKHSKCPKKCSEPCPPCAEKCKWSCSHRQGLCDLPCAVPCDMIPCDKRCEETLGCGHQCPGICGEKCPDRKFCQICGAATVLERQVDFVTFEKYKEIDANEDPLVFLSCGHFYTRSSLDGVMGMKEYYNIDTSTDTIIGPKPSRREMTGDTKLCGCPECRMPLRDIHRYNRIVKKALLDESTKKFIIMANLTYRRLIDEVQRWEMELQSERAGSLLAWSRGAEESTRGSDVAFSINAFREQGRKLQQRIINFTRSMAAVEQPYGRVNELLASAISRQKNITSDFLDMNESAIQTGFEIRGQCLQLKLNWAIFWGYETIYTSPAVEPASGSKLCETVASQVKGLRNKCLSIKASSQAAKLLPQQVEAMVYHVLFSLLYLRNCKDRDQPLSKSATDQIRQQLSAILEECKILCFQNQGQLAFLKDDIEKAKRQLDGVVFYSFVTTEEKRQVYEAMAAQFSGTGHWYYCRNNHPFTVGECGMPMEAARCPQCGEQVGGYDHTSVPGVRRAEDIEEEFGSSQSYAI